MFNHRRVHLVSEETELIAAIFLDALHRRIGVLHESFGVFTVFRENANPQATAHFQCAALNVKFGGDGTYDAFGHKSAIAGLVNRVEHDDEFISTHSGDGVLLVRLLFEPHRDLLQQRIAHGVSEGIVDNFEAAEIEKQNRNLFIPTLSAGDGLG